MTRAEKEKIETLKILMAKQRVSCLEMKEGEKYLFEGYAGLSEVGFVKKENNEYIYYGILNGLKQKVKPSPISKFIEINDQEFIKYFGRY